jgi:hypothetical protein
MFVTKRITLVEGSTCSLALDMRRFSLPLVATLSCCPSINHKALLEHGLALVATSKGLVETVDVS